MHTHYHVIYGCMIRTMVYTSIDHMPYPTNTPHLPNKVAHVFLGCHPAVSKRLVGYRHMLGMWGYGSVIVTEIRYGTKMAVGAYNVTGGTNVAKH